MFKKSTLSVLILFVLSDCPSFSFDLKQDVTDMFSSVGHSPSILNLIFSLLIVLGMIYCASWLYTKLNRYNKKKFSNFEYDNFDLNEFKVLSSMPMGQGKSLYVVEINKKFLVLGATQSNISLIKEFDKEELLKEKGSIDIQEISDLENFNDENLVLEEAHKIDVKKQQEFDDVVKKYL